MLNEAHGWSSGHPGKRQSRQTNNLFLGILLFQLHGGTTQRKSFLWTHQLTGKLENHRIICPEYPERYILFLMWVGCVISEELAEGDGVCSV